MKVEDSKNFRKLSESVSASGVVPEEALKTLAERNYDAVINLLPLKHDQAISDEREIIESQGIEYISIPVEWSEPHKSELEEFMQTLDGLGSKKVHIHCAANWRVSAFYGVYAVLKGIWSRAQANELMSSMWNKEEHPAWKKLLSEYGL